MPSILDLVVAVPLLTGCAALLCRRPRALRAVVGAGGGLGLGLAAWVLLGPAHQSAWGGLLRLDGLARVLLAVVAVVGALASADSFAHWSDDLALRGPDVAELGRGIRRVRVYFFWQQAFLASLLLAAVSGNLGLSWLAIELTTVTSAVLVGFSGSPRAVEAAWKYVVLCSVGLALALFTVILFYALAGGGGLGGLAWGALRAAAAAFSLGPAKLAFLFALVGFGTKAGLAPLHAWLPDAHSEAPAPVSALLSGVLLAVVLCTLVRIAGITAVVTRSAFPYHLLLGAGLLSVAVATPFLVLQDDLKRLLAYSSIEQVGLMAVGFGLHTPLATEGAVVQLVVHAFTKSGLFFTAGRILHEVGSQRLARLRALSRRAPLLGLAWLFGVFTLGGLPPFGMFFSELAILRAVMSVNAALGLALLGLLAVVFGGLFFYVGGGLFGPDRSERRLRPTVEAVVVLGLPAALSLVVGLWTPTAMAHGLVAAARVARLGWGPSAF